MKRMLTILWFVLFFSQTYAQKARVTSIINFTGSVGNSPIEMRLHLNNYNDSISGEYYYVKSGHDNLIYLEGTLKDGELLLTESAHNVKKGKFENTGYFRMAYVSQTSLSGTWGKKTPNAANSLVVKLKCRENLSAFNPLGFEFIMVKNKANYENITENASRYFNLLTVRINVNKSARWSLGEFSKYDLVKDEIELEDVNFDGYLDIKVPIYYPDMTKNDYSYIYFIHDVKSKGFLKNKRLNELGVLFFDAEKKEIYKYDADGGGNEGTTYYKWQSGWLFLTKEQRVYEDDVYTHYDEYKIENGKSVKVKSYKKKG
ncbi:XAC2610-related protein [Pedobacter jamesrossensis]|uniref:XAC2610-related protein n=1 Tax=Pedobacter jamesrossensis TaxID=1908238 RepID=A0ABV8NGM7_9SPHI